MSAGDRGGVGALNALIKKTKVPIIAICNDRSNPKMKPLVATCFQMTFKKCVARPSFLCGTDASTRQANGDGREIEDDVHRVQVSPSAASSPVLG